MRTTATVSDEIEPAPSADAAGQGRVVIEARRIEKVFQIPDHRVDSFKERVAHPFARSEHRELRAVREMSFDVHKGEFFGIVGRNGSGKSTLLKVLASIYRADAGTVRMAGRVAPFIELGVGFNPDLTSRENALLNGVLMGLSRREAMHRFDAILDFAELRDFADLKLKNYSSGMTVRLAFAIMVQADADIMLIDEVLAVGDASFGQKCMDVFHERRRVGKTIVLVTHDMATVQSLCHRAMLVHDGELKYIGDPEETALRYYRLNFEGPAEGLPPVEENAVPDFNARIVHARLRNPQGEAVENLEQDVPIVLDAVLEANRELRKPSFVFHVINEAGVVVSGFMKTLDEEIEVGQRVRLAGEIENRLVPGRYYLDCWIRRDVSQGEMAVQGLRLLQFVVYGTAARHGIVALRTDVTPAAEPRHVA
jgi:ABC-type polysaccharide/polyol phosphate transport system ATPase subunit